MPALLLCVCLLVLLCIFCSSCFCISLSMLQFYTCYRNKSKDIHFQPHLHRPPCPAANSLQCVFIVLSGCVPHLLSQLVFVPPPCVHLVHTLFVILSPRMCAPYPVPSLCLSHHSVTIPTPTVLVLLCYLHPLMLHLNLSATPITASFFSVCIRLPVPACNLSPAVLSLSSYPVCTFSPLQLPLPTDIVGTFCSLLL